MRGMPASGRAVGAVSDPAAMGEVQQREVRFFALRNILRDAGKQIRKGRFMSYFWAGV